jgi:hypothetical protein
MIEFLWINNYMEIFGILDNFIVYFFVIYVRKNVRLSHTIK